MYNSGAEDTSDFFALEILDGYLYLLLDLGSGATKVKVSQGRVSDGLQHLVLLEHNGKTGKFAKILNTGKWTVLFNILYN